MPYENYLTESEFRFGCPFWPKVEKYLTHEFSPNPWIFCSGCRVMPQEFCYVLTYRNFDSSQELILTAEWKDGAVKISNVVTRTHG